MKESKKMISKSFFKFRFFLYTFNQSFRSAASRNNDIGDHSIVNELINKYPQLTKDHFPFVTFEMVNKLIAGYLKFNNFDHTFFLFCKEAKINENEIFGEQLVETLKNSLLYMKNEKKVKQNLKEDILSNFGVQLDLLSRVDILILQALLIEGKITIREILSHFGCDKTSLKNAFIKFNIEYPKLKRGRPSKSVEQKKINEILLYKKKFNVGYKMMTDVLQRKGYKVSQNQVRKVYENLGLFLFEKECDPGNVHKLRFVAPFVNQIWHTDLHYLKKEEEGEK